MRILIEKLTKILLLFILISLSACEKSDKECTIPPDAFNFEIVDKTTGVNLFSNGTLKSNQIQITNSVRKTKIPFTFNSEDEANLLSLDSIGWITEKSDYTISINNKAIFDLYIDAKRVSTNCSYTVFNQILIKNADYEFNQELGAYIIKVPKQ